MKVVINSCYGGFALSQKALDRLFDLGSTFVEMQETQAVLKDVFNTYLHSFRTNDLVVRVVQELGPDSFGDHASLRIVTVPDEVDWEINDYNGREEIREISRRWN